MLENIPLIAAGVALIGLIVAFILYRQNDSIEIDNEKVADITEEIQKGAMAFLTSEYRYIGVFVVIVSVVLFLINGSDGGVETVVAFILGAVASVAAGFSGMRSATWPTAAPPWPPRTVASPLLSRFPTTVAP